MNRRKVFALGGATAALVGGAGLLSLLNTTSAQAVTSNNDFEWSLSEDEWRNLLTEVEFRVLRKHATERPFTSPLNNEKRAGTFHCAGCDLPVYTSDTKFDSGTGWPSFWKPIDGNIGTMQDNSLWAVRTEVHCRRCGGHHGHVFTDGPQPTGLRYCINGVALKFKAA